MEFFTTGRFKWEKVRPCTESRPEGRREEGRDAAIDTRRQAGRGMHGDRREGGEGCAARGSGWRHMQQG